MSASYDEGSLIDRLPIDFRSSNKRILFAVLNWGLGHAARSIPLIKALEQSGHTVIIASDGIALQLLRKECQDTTILEAPAYNIHYRSKNMAWSMATQTPKILSAVLAEQRHAKELVKKHNIDCIISDHRYGYSYKGVPSVFLAHQLKIMASNSLLSKMATTLNQYWISKFDEVWVPDFKDRRLSGDLSNWHSDSNKTVHFIGPLSRMTPIARDKKNIDLLIILSGVEPKRTQLEQKLTSLLSETRYTKVIVRGTKESIIAKDHHIYQEIHDLSTAKHIAGLMSKAKIVITRAGYSSIMDLDTMNQKAILIPTPGQTEQEYLAQHLSKNKNYESISERDIDANLLDLIEKIMHPS